jgi:hypothetical protein
MCANLYIKRFSILNSKTIKSIKFMSKCSDLISAVRHLMYSKTDVILFCLHGSKYLPVCANLFLLTWTLHKSCHVLERIFWIKSADFKLQYFAVFCNIWCASLCSYWMKIEVIYHEFLVAAWILYAIACAIVVFWQETIFFNPFRNESLMR